MRANVRLSDFRSATKEIVSKADRGIECFFLSVFGTLLLRRSTQSDECVLIRQSVSGSNEARIAVAKNVSKADKGIKCFLLVSLRYYFMILCFAKI